MPVTFIDSNQSLSASSQFATSHSNSVNVPTHQEGDLLVVRADIISNNSATGSPDASGWTHHDFAGSSGFHYRTATASEPASYSWSAVTGDSWGTIIIGLTIFCVRGADNASPVMDSDRLSFDDLTNPSTSALTITSSSLMLIGFSTFNHATTHTSSHTERENTSISNFSIRVSGWTDTGDGTLAASFTTSSTDGTIVAMTLNSASEAYDLTHTITGEAALQHTITPTLILPPPPVNFSATAVDHESITLDAEEPS